MPGVFVLTYSKLFKKILILIMVFVVLAGTVSFYYAFKYTQNKKIQKIQIKAPETSITLLEGWNIADIGSYLEKNGITKASSFEKAALQFDFSSYPLLSDKPKNASLEGYLFPDTYFIPKNPATGTDINGIIIKKTLDNFSKKFTPQMLEQAKLRGLSVYKILTLASIIEKETGRSALSQEQKQSLDEERKIVAGIFYNRLKIGMPLQSDATVNFVTKKNLPSPEIRDTEIDSPYNTYKYPGLPPGPICNPSLSSITAALYPTDTEYMYFLHDQKTGKAYYAQTYDQHLINKQKYLK